MALILWLEYNLKTWKIKNPCFLPTNKNGKKKIEINIPCLFSKNIFPISFLYCFQSCWNHLKNIFRKKTLKSPYHPQPQKKKPTYLPFLFGHVTFNIYWFQLWFCWYDLKKMPQFRNFPYSFIRKIIIMKNEKKPPNFFEKMWRYSIIFIVLALCYFYYFYFCVFEMVKITLCNLHSPSLFLGKTHTRNSLEKISIEKMLRDNFHF